MVMFVLMCGSAMAQTDATTQQTGSTYEGPGILSRIPVDVGERSGRSVNLRFFVDASGVFDTGLAPLSVDSSGNLVGVNGLWGTDIQYGVYGVHNWKNTTLGLDYHGDYRYYTQNTYFNGSDQSFSLDVQHQFTRRTELVLRETAGTISNAAGYYAPPDATGILGVPTNELFNSRAYYGNTSGQLIFQKSARLSFEIGPAPQTGPAQSAGRFSNAGLGAIFARGSSAVTWGSRGAATRLFSYRTRPCRKQVHSRLFPDLSQ